MNKKYIIDILKINQVEVIGSSSDKKLRYKSDIDLEEYVYHNAEKVKILENFQEKFKLANENKDIFIIDFKCGFRGPGEPLRWNYKHIMQGYQYIDGIKYTFISQLKKKSVIKMDIIALIDKKFVEFSNNYYFIFNRKYKTKPKKEDIYKSIIIDAIKQQQNEDVLKSLKRIYSFLKLLEINNEDTTKLINLFNSKIGHLSKQISDLKMIKTLYTNKFRTPDNVDIYYNLKLIEDNLPQKIQHILKPIFKANQNNFIEILDGIINQLNKIVYKKLIKYIQSNQLNISPTYYYNKYKFYRPQIIFKK